MAELIDGKAVAEEVVGKVKQRTAELVEAGHGRRDWRWSSSARIRRARSTSRPRARRPRSAAFIPSSTHCRPRPREAALLALIEELNADPAINGILVQLPLPDHIDVGPGHPGHRAGEGRRRLPFRQCRQARHRRTRYRLRALHAGRLDAADRARALGKDLSGLDAVVVGRSNIVGKPMANLLLAANAPSPSPTAARATLPAWRARADILVAAVGRPEMVKGDWIKPGATVIDVGINRDAATDKGEGKSRLVGDVEFEAAAKVAGAITPVPGGVGPMTIAMLMANTLTSAYLAAGRDRPTF